MKITIHQPEHLPYLGFIDKINKSDIFIIMDNVQFKKNSWQNRNRIRTFDGETYITIPVSHKKDTLIKDVQIAKVEYKNRYLTLIKDAYKNALNFEKYYSQLEKIINSSFKSLAELNCKLLTDFIYPIFGINVPILKMSEMNLRFTTDGSNKVLAICEECQKIFKNNDITYISGIGGKKYLRLEEFKKSNILVVFNEFKHPIYKQQYEPFIPNMSCLDYIMNCEV